LVLAVLEEFLVVVVTLLVEALAQQDLLQLLLTSKDSL
jgi:hypothetical protein